MCSPAIFETYFSHDKDIWIAVTDYYIVYIFLYIYFYFIILSPLTAIL